MRMYFSIIFLLFTTSTLAGPVLDIEFNGSQLLLGTFEGTKSSSEFYSYGSPNGASANPRYPDTGELIALQADTLQIFSYLETDTNILSLGFILEKYQGSGGGTFQTQATWSDPARVSLLDDPGETGSNITDTSRDFNFTWVNCCTDGFVISGFDPDDMFLDLKNTTGSDLTNVVFLQQ